MSKNSSIYEFKYSGEYQAIDAHAVLVSQIHLISIITEIKNQVEPNAELNIKLQGLEKGSLEVLHLIDLVLPATIFLSDKYATIKNIFDLFADVLNIKKFLGEKKADEVVKQGDNSVNIVINIQGDSNTINVAETAWKLYSENTKINDSLMKVGKALEESEDLDELAVKKLSDDRILAKLNRDDFKKIKKENPYSGNVFNYEVEKKQIVGIKNPNLIPEPGRVFKWEVLYRRNNISLKISDQEFIDKILNGLRFGNGDKLLVDIKKTMRLDTTYNMFVETGRYEATKVHKIIPRQEQVSMDM